MAANPPQLGSSATGGVQADWQNREFVELLTSQIRKITEFLNNFDTTARYPMISTVLFLVFYCSTCELSGCPHVSIPLHVPLSSRLSELNSKLTRLETRVSVLEARLPPLPHPSDAAAPAPPAAAASK